MDSISTLLCSSNDEITTFMAPFIPSIKVTQYLCTIIAIGRACQSDCHETVPASISCMTGFLRKNQFLLLYFHKANNQLEFFSSAQLLVGSLEIEFFKMRLKDIFLIGQLVFFQPYQTTPTFFQQLGPLSTWLNLVIIFPADCSLNNTCRTLVTKCVSCYFDVKSSIY